MESTIYLVAFYIVIVAVTLFAVIGFVEFTIWVHETRKKAKRTKNSDPLNSDHWGI